MNRWLVARPISDGELFDMLHSLFGVGDFDSSGDVPWYRFRMTEIAKLKSMRARRQISLADLAVAARYCYHHRIKVGAPWELTPHLAEAKREARINIVSPLNAQVRGALELERSLPGPDSDTWIERLLLTRGPHRTQVLEAWKRARQSTHHQQEEGSHE